jgi:hypothetical protein
MNFSQTRLFRAIDRTRPQYHDPDLEKAQRRSENESYKGIVDLHLLRHGRPCGLGPSRK